MKCVYPPFQSHFVDPVVMEVQIPFIRAFKAEDEVEPCWVGLFYLWVFHAVIRSTVKINIDFRSLNSSFRGQAWPV